MQTGLSPSGILPALSGDESHNFQRPHHRLATHQLRILKEMDEKGNLGIFAEAGTGKTMIALTWIHRGLIDGSLNDVLVICPASLIASWHRSIDRMIEFEGYTSLDVELMHEYIHFISYSRVWQAYTKTVKHHDNTTTSTRRYRLRPEIDHHWDVVFMDESHALGSHNSIQTKACLQVALLSTHRFVMTGTPDSGKYEKLYGQLKVVEPNLWSTWGQFSRELIIAKDAYGNPLKYDVDKGEALKRRYGTVARLRECFDMPGETETDVPCEIGNVKAYRDILKGRTDKYGITVTASGTCSIKAMQVCSGHVRTDTGLMRFPNNKLDALRDIAESGNDKIVVFCKFSQSISDVCDLFTKMGWKHHRFDGTVKEPVWQDFLVDDSRAIVVQYQRGGEGLDLYASHRMVFYEPTYMAKDLEQAKARIMRKGQTEHCQYYYLYCQNTIEEKAMRSVRNRVDVSRAMLEEWAKELQS